MTLLISVFVLAAVTVRVVQAFIVKLRETIRMVPSQVEVSDLPLYPGQRYEVALFQSGRMRLSTLDLSIVCEEHAMFMDGTNLRTETRRVRRQSILQKYGVEVTRLSPFAHACELVVPNNAMHSFQSSSNAVRWHLVLSGKVKRGPTFERVFPILVYPRVTTPGRN